MLKSYLKFMLYLAMTIGVSGARAGAYEDFFKAMAVDDGGTVQALLQRGFDPNSRNESGQTPLYLALRDGNFKVAEALLARPDLRQDLLNANGESALMMAGLKGHADWVKRLIDRGARIEGADTRAWTALHYAATGPSTAALQLLLAKGAQIDARSPNGSTALMMAARYGAETSVAVLLDKGADARLLNDMQLGAADFARLGGREALAAQLGRLTR